MIRDDSAYHAERALIDLTQAQRGTEPKAAQAHQQLAKAYLEQAQPDPSSSAEQAT